MWSDQALTEITTLNPITNVTWNTGRDGLSDSHEILDYTVELRAFVAEAKRRAILLDAS
jgi:hypothetical protein